MPAQALNQWREVDFGRRAARIANCSGYHGDPTVEMYNLATGGDVDFITGDYLAEVNIANNAEAYASGKHPGYEESAWCAIRDAIDVLHEKQIKVAVNGGALNPAGLAARVADLAKSKGYNLKVAYVSGDNLLSEVGLYMPQKEKEALPHLDSINMDVNALFETFLFAKDETMEPRKIVSANAYLGARAIYHGFHKGADIVICGRVSDASPVIAAAWYWWSWEESNYDQLAGALIAGHLIECSAYVTGGNFTGFDMYDDLHQFITPGFPIAEVAQDGTCIITKHPGTGGMVTDDTCKCQLLYELQGNAYLNSDVTAILDDVVIEEVEENRVRIRGVKGSPPPSSTKLAVFYKGGFEAQLLLNATGYGVEKKFELLEKQMRHRMGEEAIRAFDVLEFQCIGVPATSPATQNSSTVYFRIFAQATDEKSLKAIPLALGNISLRHFSGFHSSLDMRTALPRPYLAYYPALWPQNKLTESVNFIEGNGQTISMPTGHPTNFQDLGRRASYDTKDPQTLDGPTKPMRLGDFALGRSGDKGGNLNFGLFVHTKDRWDWLRTYFTRAKVAELLGTDMRPGYTIERVEFPGIFAVHFVVYGILGRGVSSSVRLDGFGKGFVDYFRDKVVEVPVSII